MSRRCEITGKGPSTGQNRSHSNRATKRRFLPNLIKKRIFDSTTGRFTRVRIATSTLRTLLKQDRRIKQAK